jgi:hypothetical protein
MILDPTRLESLMIARRPVSPVTVDRLGLFARPTSTTANGRDVVKQLERLNRVVSVRSGDPHSQRDASAIDDQVPLGSFFRSIRGIFACKSPPKTARIDWLSTQTFSQSIPFSCPIWRRRA